VLETREVLPVGAETGVRVDVRIVCATHRDLHALVAQGKFRGDLLARINGCTLNLPALRDRKEDLYLLVRHFWQANGGAGEPPVTFPFMTALAAHDWPYNVRELSAVVTRAMAMARGEPLDVIHLPEAMQAAFREYGTDAPRPEATGLEAARPDAARPAAALGSGVTGIAPGARQTPTAEELVDLLKRHEGNLAAVARELGKDRKQIRRWLSYHALDAEAFRPGK
jgi:DNA-binding NtrC family response regulator